MPTGLGGTSRMLYKSVVAADDLGAACAIGRGADLETMFTEGITMLMIAAQRGHVAMWKPRLGANAPIDTGSKFGY